MATIQPIRPSAAIQSAYEARMVRVITRMHRDVNATITKAYRSNTPEIVIYAQDASPAMVLRGAVSTLRRRWARKFDDLSSDLASYFATATRDRCERTLKADLRKAGFTVRFKATPAMNDAYQAIIGENIALIKSIPAQYLTRVETIVMQSVQAGYDLGRLTSALEDQFGVTKRRAATIAVDQAKKANATMLSARELALGIIEGIWRHSAGGREPRPAHVAFSGQRFPLAQGHDFDDGNGKILPGTIFGCRCVWEAVIPGLE